MRNRRSDPVLLKTMANSTMHRPKTRRMVPRQSDRDMTNSQPMEAPPFMPSCPQAQGKVLAQIFPDISQYGVQK